MHPVIFDLPIFGGLPIYSYGVMLGIAFIAGWYLTLYLSAKDGYGRQVPSTTLTLAIIFSLVGARLLYVLTNLERFDNLIDIFRLRQGGLVAYGGYLGGAVSAYVYLTSKKQSFWRFADCATPSLGLGLGLTRIGCFLYGCDFGTASHLPWAVTFPKGSPAYTEQLTKGLIAADATQSLPIHPTQLYSSLNGLLLFAILMVARRWKRFHGQTFLTFVILYGITRFFLEFVRDDSQRGGLLGMSTSQFIAIVSLLAAVGGIFILKRHGLKSPPPAKDPPQSQAATAKVRAQPSRKPAKAKKKGKR